MKISLFTFVALFSLVLPSFTAPLPLGWSRASSSGSSGVKAPSFSSRFTEAIKSRFKDPLDSCGLGYKGSFGSVRHNFKTYYGKSDSILLPAPGMAEKALNKVERNFNLPSIFSLVWLGSLEKKVNACKASHPEMELWQIFAPSVRAIANMKQIKKVIILTPGNLKASEGSTASKLSKILPPTDKITDMLKAANPKIQIERLSTTPDGEPFKPDQQVSDASAAQPPPRASFFSRLKNWSKPKSS